MGLERPSWQQGEYAGISYSRVLISFTFRGTLRFFVSVSRSRVCLGFYFLLKASLSHGHTSVYVHPESSNFLEWKEG
jgi:hypothetical protein